MYSSISVVQPPAVEPVTLAAFQTHARIDYQTDSTMQAMYLTAARMAVEQFLGRALITQTLQWVLAHQAPINQFPLVPFTAYIFPMWMPYSMLFQRPIEIPRAPVTAITSIAVGQWGQPDTVLTADQYSVDISTEPARLKLHAGGLASDHTIIRFQAGYGADGTSVPAPILIAILMMATFLYEHRGDDGGEMPDVVKNLLWPYRLYFFGDPDG